MIPEEAIEVIKTKFNQGVNPANVLLLKGDLIKAELIEDGIKVNNQGNDFFLPWSVFEEIMNLLVGDPKTIPSGDVNNKPDDCGLYLTPIGKGIAHVVYGKNIKYATFKRIASIVAILIWAGICRYESGYIIMNE